MKVKLDENLPAELVRELIRELCSSAYATRAAENWSSG
jgi:hypothetical protein